MLIDCGANIGVHTIECAVEMTGWGSVLGIEAQERLYYALAGNIALNNCFNARALHAAVAAQDGTMRVPVPDYLQPGSFGSLELKPRGSAELIGQTIDYSPGAAQEIRSLTLDSLGLARIDAQLRQTLDGFGYRVFETGKNLLAVHPTDRSLEHLQQSQRSGA